MVSEATRPPNGMLSSLLSCAACYETKSSLVAGPNNCLVKIAKNPLRTIDLNLTSVIFWLLILSISGLLTIVTNKTIINLIRYKEGGLFYEGHEPCRCKSKTVSGRY